jgi:starch synthase
MLDAILRAKAYYEKRMQWGKLVSRAMREDFSWKRSAKLYIGLYSDI